MDWFTPLVSKDKLHSKFLFMLDPQYTSERKLFTEWTSSFIIKDGLDKTVKEFQTTFHSVFWEVYLNKVITCSNGTINGDVSSPDFIITKNNKTTCMEAVIANIAQDKPKENERTIEDVYGDNDHYEILDESIIRLYGAVTSKLEKYKDSYSKSKTVESSPFVIAIGDYGQINFGQSYYYPMLAILYNAYYDPNDEKDLLILCCDNYEREYKYIEHHLNKNKKELKLGFFSSNENKNISAILYSCTLTLGKLTSLCENHTPLPKTIALTRDNGILELDICRHSGSMPDETLLDGTFIFHNPYAEKPLPDSFIEGKGLTHIYFKPDEGELEIVTKGSMTLKRRFISISEVAPELIPNYNEYLWMPFERS